MTDLETQYKECVASIVPSAERAGALATIASELRDQGRHLGAAICSLAGHMAAWGQEPQELCPRLLVDTINDLLRFLGDGAPGDWNRLLALQLLVQRSARPFFFGDTALQLAQIQESAKADYYFLLSRMAEGHLSADALLVSGFQLRGFLDSHWKPVFPGFEVVAGTTITSGDGNTYTFGMDSGFRSLLSLGDYDGAMRVSEAHKGALITPGLRGWSIASSAFLTGDSGSFADASVQFNLDSIDRVGRKESSWSGINQQLWAPYFMSRSHMAAPCATPREAIENLRKASGSGLSPAPSGWHVPQVSRYIQLIAAVCGLADGDADAVKAAIQGYQSSSRFDLPSSFDSYVMDFLGHIQSLSRVQEGGEWIEPLCQILSLLDRLPIFTTGEKLTITSALNLAVPNSLQWFERGWVYETLTSIKDERQLHRILLAIFRAEAEAPRFSQIRHGPIEYGKDIVVCREDDGRRVLWMYSVKVGELKKAAWNQKVRPQLEEIFQVPFKSSEIPDEFDEQVGVLVWNDHIHPYADPLVKGWLKEQRDTFGRRYELMHIDSLVNYVGENGLGAPLRKALRAEGLLR